MSDPEEWTDADPATLPQRWHDPETDADDDPTCERCGADIDRGPYCEDCQTLLDRARTRR